MYVLKKYLVKGISNRASYLKMAQNTLIQWSPSVKTGYINMQDFLSTVLQTTTNLIARPFSGSSKCACK